MPAASTYSSTHWVYLLFLSCPSYPAPSLSSQTSFSGVWIKLTNFIYSSPAVAYIPSHPSMVIVLTKATRPLTTLPRLAGPVIYNILFICLLVDGHLDLGLLCIMLL